MNHNVAASAHAITQTVINNSIANRFIAKNILAFMQIILFLLTQFIWSTLYRAWFAVVDFIDVSSDNFFSCYLI